MCGVFCGVSPLLALYGTGQTTGVVLEMGAASVSTACAADGCAVTAAMQRSVGVCGGDSVNEYLRVLLRSGNHHQQQQRGGDGTISTTKNVSGSNHPSPPTESSESSSAAAAAMAMLFGSGSSAELEMIREMKESCCRVLPYCSYGSSSSHYTSSPSLMNSHGHANSFVADGYDRRRAALAAVNAAIAACNNSGGSGGVTDDATTSSELSSHFQLPDGTVINTALDGIAFQAAEAHFSPALLGHGAGALGVVDLVMDTVHHSSINGGSSSSGGAVDSLAAPLLLGNVFISGGASLMHGFAPRLLSELRARTTITSHQQRHHQQRQHRSLFTVRVSAPLERGHGAWLGAAFLSQLSTFQSMCVSRAQYLEAGEGALHARLFA